MSMKKFPAAILIAAVVCWAAAAGAAQGARSAMPQDFRKARWGMTVEQVKKIETAEFRRSGKDSLIYWDNKQRCIVQYIFEKGRLVEGSHYYKADSVEQVNKLFPYLLEALSANFPAVPDLHVKNLPMQVFKSGRNYLFIIKYIDEKRQGVLIKSVHAERIRKDLKKDQTSLSGKANKANKANRAKPVQQNSGPGTNEDALKQRLKRMEEKASDLLQ